MNPQRKPKEELSNQQRLNKIAKEKGARIERGFYHIVHCDDGSVIVCKSYSEADSAVRSL